MAGRLCPLHVNDLIDLSKETLECHIALEEVRGYLEGMRGRATSNRYSCLSNVIDELVHVGQAEVALCIPRPQLFGSHCTAALGTGTPPAAFPPNEDRRPCKTVGTVTLWQPLLP